MTPQELLEITRPGNHPETVTFEDMMPCGRCAGVVYLKGGVQATENADGTIEVKEITDESCEKEALRYLAPMPALWRALHAGKDGISTPHGVEVMFTKDMYELERTLRRPLRFVFAATEHGIYAAHPKYRNCWKIVKVAPTIWVFVFDKPKAVEPAVKPEPVTPDVRQVVEAEVAGDVVQK